MSKETVLVAVDVMSGHKRSRMFDEVSDHAARGARIVLVTVVPEIYLATTPDAKGMIKAMMDHAAGQLAEVAAAAPFDVADQIVRYGPVAPGIIDVAAESGATLIVINARQRDRTAYLLGSVASRVANHAPCSVHVVRA